MLGQVREGLEGLLEVGHRLVECGAVKALAPACWQQVTALSHISPRKAWCASPFDLFGQSVRIQCLDGLDDAHMEAPPPLLQEASVGHLVGQGVLEGVGEFREKARLIEELGGLQVCQPTVQRPLGQLRNGLEEGEWHLCAN